MKLTTMKISVPVLMLMMFQSGYGVSDWFEKAWGLMNQGKKAEAYAVVKQAGHGADKIYPQDRDQCFSVWSKAVSDAVSEKLPSYYYDDKGELTPEPETEDEKLSGQALRDEIIKLNDKGIISDGEYYDYFIHQEGPVINPKIVKNVFLDTIVANVYTPGFEPGSDSSLVSKIMNEGQSSAWLLPDNNLLAGFIDPDESEREDSRTANRHAGIYAWASRIAHKWQPSDDPGELIDNNWPYLVKEEDSSFVLDLRDNIDLGYNEDPETSSEVMDVIALIKNKADVAYQAIQDESYDEQIAKIKDLANSLRDAVEGVLIERIKDNLRDAKEAEEAEDDNTKAEAESKARENLSNYLKVAFNRTIDTNSSTVKAYGTEWGLLNEHDPLEAILAVAVADDNAQAAVADEDSVDDDTVINIRSATEQVMADDLSLLLRSDKERRNILDEYIMDDTGTKVNMTKVERALRKIAQPLADDVTDSVVENLQLIQANWVEPNPAPDPDPEP